jgi:hypothetical protein
MSEHSSALLGPSREAVLRVGIKDKNRPAHGCEFASQVPGDCGFANTAFSPHNCNDGHRKYYKGNEPEKAVVEGDITAALCSEDFANR